MKAKDYSFFLVLRSLSSLFLPSPFLFLLSFLFSNCWPIPIATLLNLFPYLVLFWHLSPCLLLYSLPIVLSCQIPFLIICLNICFFFFISLSTYILAFFSFFSFFFLPPFPHPPSHFTPCLCRSFFFKNTPLK